MDEEQTTGYSYGKRPLWQWIVLYAVIGGALYALAYYFFFSGSGYGQGAQYQPTVDQITQPTNSQPVPQTTSAQTSPSLTPQPSPTPSSVSASIANFAFDPGTITVKNGDTVTWKNNDTAPHTVTGDNGGPASPRLLPGAQYSYTFNTAGTFAYHCAIHPNMRATVIVTQ